MNEWMIERTNERMNKILTMCTEQANLKVFKRYDYPCHFFFSLFFFIAKATVYSGASRVKTSQMIFIISFIFLAALWMYNVAVLT